MGLKVQISHLVSVCFSKNYLGHFSLRWCGWSGLDKPDPPNFSPLDYGWILEAGECTIRWFYGKELPGKIEDVILNRKDSETETDDSDISSSSSSSDEN